ncbi:MAG: fibronectin type III-like domain-contianing protein, partial [Bacteroidales bacterium]|nr:fibronectin type III-like domain-contianing protein [Bacteroidales bacterium]
DEVVQLYVQRLGSQQRAKALRGFSRVSIPAGKTITVSFPIDEAAVGFFDKNTGDVAALNATYLLMTGGSSRQEDLQSVTINW